MEETRRLSLQEEIRKEAQRIEKEIKEHPELEEMTVSEDLETALLKKIRAYEKEEAEKEKTTTEKTDKDAEFSEELVPEISDMGKTVQMKKFAGTISIGKTAEHMKEKKVEVNSFTDTTVEVLAEKEVPAEKGSVLYHKKRKSLVLFVLVAVLICILGMGITSVGSKSYMKEIFDRLQGKVPMNIINVEDMDDKMTEDVDELVVYSEIDKELGISSVRLTYRPKDMILSWYNISTEMQQARLFYEYGDEIIRYNIYINDRDSSVGRKKEDIKIDEYSVLVNNIEIKVEEIKVKKNEVYKQIANWKYKDVYYQLSGIIKREEFEEILQNLHFYEKNM